MNGPLIDPMTGTLATVEHAAAQPQARTKEAFAAALAMLSPELQEQFFQRVTKEAKKCGLPSCTQMTLHRGGYCCKEHKADHKRLLILRDNPLPPFASGNGPTARVDCNLCDKCMDALKVDKSLAWMGHTDEGGGVMCDKCGQMQARLCFLVKKPPGMTAKPPPL